MRIILLLAVLSGCTVYDTRDVRKYYCRKQLDENKLLDNKSSYTWCNIAPYDRVCPCYGVTL